MTPVSIVIPAYLSHETIAGTLSALLPQLAPGDEVVVVDTSPDERTAQVVAAFPEVRLLRPPERMWPGTARNAGVEASRGERLVTTDPDCAPQDGWLAALTATLDGGADIAMGPTRSERGACWRARGVHRAKYPWWSSSVAPGSAMSGIPSSNLALERATWDELEGFGGDRWHADTLLAWRAAERGMSVVYAPDAVLEHVAEPDLRRFLHEREERGRTFATLRATRAGWSRPVLLARVLAAPVVPPLLLARSLRLSRRGEDLADALLTAPITLLGFGAWALGEARGLLAVVGRRPAA